MEISKQNDALGYLSQLKMENYSGEDLDRVEETNEEVRQKIEHLCEHEQ